MTGEAAFLLTGAYRVQSRRRWSYSELGGQWMHCASGLTSTTVDQWLSKQKVWAGRTHVNLRPARISLRTGMFADEPDILYKREFFVGAQGCQMEADIVDVEKSVTEWHARYPFCEEIFEPEQLEVLVDMVASLDEVIADEYFVHEAGHFLGIDVAEKYRSGYFRANDQTLWPLIYAEELRADLGGFQAALDLLPERSAVAVFIYNIMLRLGSHRSGLRRGVGEVYGLVPYLLFCILREYEIARVDSRDGRAVLRFQALSRTRLLEMMQLVARHAHLELTLPELVARDALDRALATARYVRRRLDDDRLRTEFAEVMS